MKLVIKKFEDLTNDELYEILKLRVDVFVVEQACPYPDLDNLDQEAIHVFFKDKKGIQAYLRIMDREVESEHVSIGRVIAAQRRKHLGTSLMKEAIKISKKNFDADKIYLEAQVYARDFYEKFGFKQTSEIFALDGIDHIKMELSLE